MLPTMFSLRSPISETAQPVPEHRTRLLQAMGSSAADRGFAATTIADIVREAGVSKRTFYEHFVSKEACFLALYRAVSASALRTLSESVRPEKPWHHQIETALNAYFGHLSAGPRLLRTLFVEIHHLGDEGALVRREVMQHLADFLLQTVNSPSGGLVASPALSPTMAMAAVGGINELVLMAIERGEAEQLTRLTPAASEIVRALAHVPAER
jgi:AcrR family transcriptional regulator